jgi:hypothetical protein
MDGRSATDRGKGHQVTKGHGAHSSVHMAAHKVGQQHW